MTSLLRLYVYVQPFCIRFAAQRNSLWVSFLGAWVTMDHTTVYDKNDTRNRLIEAVLVAWETRGRGAVSVRAIAQAAGVPPSSLYHHFGEIEHLYEAAQAAATAAAEQWCAAQVEALAGIEHLAIEAMGPLLATLIDDWARDGRRLAFAWREYQLMAARDPRYAPACQDWRRMWHAFWQRLCSQVGQPAVWELIALFFDGESFLHLMRWRRAIDRPALEETCAAWTRWLRGEVVEEGPLRRLAREQALCAMPDTGHVDGPAAAIAGAAADILEKSGVAGLTHRAVAVQAGLTLGTVSHKFRTSADLVRAAYEACYARLTRSEDGAARFAGLEEDAALRLAAGMYYSRQLAIEELMLVSARDDTLRPFMPQLRYLRGRTARLLLQVMVGPARPISALDSALFSTFSMGMMRACIGMEDADRQAYMERMIRSLPILSQPQAVRSTGISAS
jgi:AcrR family transcriptional regulator